MQVTLPRFYFQVFSCVAFYRSLSSVIFRKRVNDEARGHETSQSKRAKNDTCVSSACLFRKHLKPCAFFRTYL